ncbi:MAG: glycosyltransferase [Pyrinomonadaceae bacterium]|nr:glycosyltransferase [Pyrinomonadaceae bacterium]
MLAILTTHPIQYQVPLWQALARDGSVPFEVWYLSDHGVKPSFDVEFKKSFAWDLDMLAGHPHRFLKVNSDANVDRFNKLRLVEPLEKVFREKNVRALWVQGWQVRAYWQAVWQAHAAGIPIWLRGESNDLQPTPPMKKQIKRILLGQFFRRVSEFLYIGQANRRLYESFGARAEQLHPAPYCVDNQRFARQAEELRPQRAEFRRQWNIPKDALCILFAGKFIPKKHPLDLITATLDSRLRNLGLRLHLLFVGAGELGRELREVCHVAFDADDPKAKHADAAQLNGHAPYASFTGFLNQTEISKAYVAADCLVLPSDYGETWGLVVNEAMASGLSCLASDACGCSEDLIAPLNPAYRFRVGDAASLASALLSFIEQPASSAALREQVDKFNLSVSVETVRRLYQSSYRNGGICESKKDG